MNYSDKVNKTYFKDNKYANVGNTKHNINPIFNLRLSEQDKYANDCQWFKDYAEWIVPANETSIQNFDEMKLAYEVYNDNLEGFKKELDEFCNPLGENLGQIEEEIRPYPKLHNKVNVLKGELIKRNDNIKIILLSAKAVKDKNKQLLEALKASLEEQVLLEVEKVQMEMQGLSPEEINKYIENLRTELSPEDINQKDFTSEWEIFYNKGLKYCYYDQNVKSKKVETLEDVLISDRCFIYSGWQHGKPHLEIRNTLYTGFQKQPNEMMIHKGDYVWYKKPITIADVYNYYGHLLSNDEIETLGIHTYSSNKIDKRHALGPHEHQYVRSTVNEEIFNLLDEKTSNGSEDKRIGMHQGQGMNRADSKNSLVWETHIEFKAYRELGFLSYINDYGDPITVVLSKDFKAPDDAEEIEYTNIYGHKTKKLVWEDKFSGTEYNLEYIYIPRKYEVIRLGESIYPICREVPYQTTNIDNPFSSFNLSTFGAIFTSRNAKSISPLQRAIPSYFQYLFVKHIQNRELAKYEGYIQNLDIDQIPDELGKDIDGNTLRDPIATWMLYRKKTGLNIYSGSQTSISGVLPSTRSPGSSGYILGTAAEIFNLQQLLEYIDREIGMAMGISPQREASFSQHSNVSDNMQAITQSHHITEPYFYYLDQVWKDALTDYLKNFRTYCQLYLQKTGELPMFHYILPDGVEELFKITPKMLELQDIGLFVSNAMNDQKYYEYMMNLSQAFSQNAGEGIEVISALIKSITSGTSPEEVHKLIKIEGDKQAQRMQQQEELKLKVQEEYIARERENREDNQAHEIEKIIIKAQEDRKTALEKAAIDLYKFTEDKNQDADGIPDYIEALEAVRKMNETQKKLRQKDRELDLKEKDIEVKKEIANKKAKQSKS